MSYPHPAHDGDLTIGHVYTSVLGAIASEVAQHERVTTAQFAARPAGALIAADGSITPGTWADGEFRPS